MDDQKKKAIATAAKEVVKRPYNEITWNEGTSGHSPKLGSLEDRIFSAAECFIFGGASLFVTWLFWFTPGADVDVGSALRWILAAATFMALVAFVHPGLGLFLLNLIGYRIKK